MQELGVPLLGWEGPMEKEMATKSSILAWGISGTEESGGLSPQGCKELDTIEGLSMHACTFH